MTSWELEVTDRHNGSEDAPEYRGPFPLPIYQRPEVAGAPAEARALGG